MDYKIEEQKTKVNKWLIILVLLLLIIGFFVIKNALYRDGIAYKNIKSELTVKGDLSITANGFGKFISRNDEIISTKIAGRVEQIELYPGDAVYQGQPILLLSNPDLDYEYLQQKESLESLKIQLIEEQLNQTEKINNLKDELEKAVLEIDIKQKTYASNLKLYEKGIVSELSFLKSESDLTMAKLTVKKLERNVSRAMTERKNIQKIHEKKMNLELSKFNKLELKLKAKSIKSPIDGIVKQISIGKGDEVNIGKTLAVIGNKQPDAAKIQFPQYFLKSIAPGMKLKMFYANEEISAFVSRVDPKIENNYITVEVSLPSESAKSALIDMNVNAEITVRILKGVTYIQQPSYYNESNPYLFVIKDNSVIKTKVTAEIEGNNNLIIKSGVSAGENILISNHVELKNNDVVEIVQ